MMVLWCKMESVVAAMVRCIVDGLMEATMIIMLLTLSTIHGG
jgi:hypothetical protein